jgi:DNA-directed RNA polymerase subunit RPC12/RpoP
MDNKKFSKNDEGFICKCCGKKVEQLNYTSRDHCPYCLTSLHIDINPGDRQNNCLGTLIPISVNYTNQKGYVITYKCEKCGKLHNNKSAKDDDLNTILSVMNGTYNINNYKK